MESLSGFNQTHILHEYGIRREYKKKEHTVIEIDTSKAKYFGMPWKTLGAFGKRKLENFIMLNRPKERLKFIYG